MKAIWQLRSSSSLCTQRTSSRRPWADELRASWARNVPKEKSPRTQMTRGDCADENTASGQSTKLGNVAKKLALLRYSAAVDCCAQRGSATHARRQATSVKPSATDLPSRVALHAAARTPWDARDTGGPSNGGQVRGHLAVQIRS